jgi:DNA repair exonuclease SbcCD ATPase subunit
MATITKLTSENIKRIKAVEIEPSGAAVVIGGRNAQGKSSVLDSIEAAIGGKAHCPEVPIREGETTARVVLETEDIVVTRTFRNTEDESKTKTSLVVTTKDGARFGSPQKVLDKLVGHLSFDPLEFTRMKPADQAETLRDLVGLDTAELERKERQAFSERTIVGRGLKAAKARLEEATFDPDAPSEIVSSGSLAAKYSELQEQKMERDETIGRIEVARAHIEEYTEILEDLRNRLGEMPVITSEDMAAAADQMTLADRANEAVRKNEEYARRKMAVMRAQAAHDKCTGEINEARAAITKAVESVRYPIDGLQVTERGVELNGLPFAQASSSEQLRTSVAMGFALHPELRVLLIRDGSLLDEDALAAVTEMATAAGGQVWIERVSDGDEVSVVIEDGAIKC